MAVSTASVKRDLEDKVSPQPKMKKVMRNDRNTSLPSESKIRTSNTKVFVRVRPLNNHEKSQNIRSTVKVIDDKMLIFDPKEETGGCFFHGVKQKSQDIAKNQNKDMKFTFDRVFDEDSTNEEVYKESTKEIMNTLLEGYNCSVTMAVSTASVKRDLEDKVSPQPKMKKVMRNDRNTSLPSESKIRTSNTKVFVRVRPLNNHEKSQNIRSTVKVIDDKMLIFDPKEETGGCFFHGVKQKSQDIAKNQNKDMKFTFDRVFDEDSTNEEVYKESTKEIMNTLLEGYNCSVFVYGATGAGKTHTMLGSEQGPGIIILTMTELYRRIDQLKETKNIEISISYLEVYNENLHDLIYPRGPMQLREDSNGEVIVVGKKVEEILHVDQLFQLLQKGNSNRTQHPTDTNAESSRSHAVFQVYVKSVAKDNGELKISKLSMIDLAGSERGSATGGVKAMFKEGCNINKSLLSLGNCINSLADGLPHIPYQNSKLTRFLKDSLGGNCFTVMIANVSPSKISHEDTYNTLQYATRAKKIKSELNEPEKRTFQFKPHTLPSIAKSATTESSDLNKKFTPDKPEGLENEENKSRKRSRIVPKIITYTEDGAVLMDRFIPPRLWLKNRKANGSKPSVKKFNPQAASSNQNS